MTFQRAEKLARVRVRVKTGGEEKEEGIETS